MSHITAQGEIDLTCNIAWRLAESDNGDVETIVDVTSETMPHGMSEAIQAWIGESCDGVDWVTARPRNCKVAAECVEASARTAPNRLRNRQPQSSERS